MSHITVSGSSGCDDHAFVPSRQPPNAYRGAPSMAGVVFQYTDTPQYFPPGPSNTQIAQSGALQNFAFVPFRSPGQNIPQIGQNSWAIYHAVEKAGPCTFQNSNRVFPRSHNTAASCSLRQQDYYQQLQAPGSHVPQPSSKIATPNPHMTPRGSHSFATISGEALFPVYAEPYRLSRRSSSLGGNNDHTQKHEFAMSRTSFDGITTAPSLGQNFHFTSSGHATYPDNTEPSHTPAIPHFGDSRSQPFEPIPWLMPDNEMHTIYDHDLLSTSDKRKTNHQIAAIETKQSCLAELQETPSLSLPFSHIQHISRTNSEHEHGSFNVVRTCTSPGIVNRRQFPDLKACAWVSAHFILKMLPLQVYNHLLFRLPLVYFLRVARIFEEAGFSLPEIKNMVLETALTDGNPERNYIFDSTNLSRKQIKLKSTWEAFIDSLIREWEMFNLISVLLLSAILTILQINSAAQDPITRYTALSSSICALISILIGCMFIIRFGSMRHMYKAAEWALEATKTRTTPWWNVWVWVAMPAIWLTWSIILYIACIMTFIWRSSPQDDSPPIVMSKTALLVVRVAVSAVLGLGVVYGGLTLMTFRRYGHTMDKAWKIRIDAWAEEKNKARELYNNPMSPSDAQNPQHHFPLWNPSLPSLRPSEFAPTESVHNARNGLSNTKPATASQPGISVSPLHCPQKTRSDSGQNFANQTNFCIADILHSDTVEPHNTVPIIHRKNGTDHDSLHEYTPPNLPPKVHVPPSSHPKSARKKHKHSARRSSSQTRPGTPCLRSQSYLTPTVDSDLLTNIWNQTYELGIRFERIMDEDPGPNPDNHFRSPLVIPQEPLYRGNKTDKVQSRASEPTVYRPVPRMPSRTPLSFVSKVHPAPT